MAPMIFRINPVLAISIILILPVPKMMAFGGVATGNMKAIDAESVAGIMKSKGFVWVDIDNPAKTGSNISVVATLEVNSVKKVIIRAIVKIIRMG